MNEIANNLCLTTQQLTSPFFGFFDNSCGLVTLNGIFSIRSLILSINLIPAEHAWKKSKKYNKRYSRCKCKEWRQQKAPIFPVNYILNICYCEFNYFTFLWVELCHFYNPIHAVKYLDRNLCHPCWSCLKLFYLKTDNNSDYYWI